MYYKFTKFDTVNMNIAFLTATLSYCEKRKVGAVIVKDNRIIANGYNGTLSGKDNLCEDLTIECKCGKVHVFKDKPKDKILSEEKGFNNSFTYSIPDDESLDYYKCENEKDYYRKVCVCHNVLKFTREHLSLKSNTNVIHAEQNAILFAARNGISINGATIFVTTAPCIECAKFIAGSGIKKVIWKDIYKNFDGIDYLHSNNIECYRYDLMMDKK